jgi:acyl carrier protein
MSSADGPLPTSRSAEEIRQWMVVRLSRLLGVQPNEIDANAPIAYHGLDSVQMVLLVTDLEQWLGVKFQTNPLTEQSTISSLAEHLATLQPRP